MAQGSIATMTNDDDIDNDHRDKGRQDQDDGTRPTTSLQRHPGLQNPERAPLFHTFIVFIDKQC